MVLLSLPEIDNIQLLDDIISNKKTDRREKLQHYRRQVIDRYTFFESHFNALDEIKPLDSTAWHEVKDDLHSCFGNNVAFNQAKAKIFSGITRCPYCTLNRPNTLDHYFDKSEYPEFVVYSPNLIPCCSECNSIKGTGLFDDVGARQFIHFYLDEIPEFQFLFVRFYIESDEQIPQVVVSLHFEESQENEKHIEAHYSKLNLLRKYRDTIIGRIPSVLDEFRMAKECGIKTDSLKEMIMIRFQSLSKNYGCNYWETCMYEGILNSDGFLDILFDYH